MAQWCVISEKIGKLNRFVKKNADFVRLFHAGVKMVELDASGRILIAKDLAGFAGLERELVFSGTPFGVEIWSRSAYESAVNPSDLDFAQLAEDVMGGQNGDHELP
jgi:MraZ protein